MTSVLFTLSIRTRNPLNMSTGNTRVAAILRTRERSVNRHVAWINALNAMRKGGLSSVDLVPCVVHLTRISSGKMDDDGLGELQGHPGWDRRCAGRERRGAVHPIRVCAAQGAAGDLRRRGADRAR